MVQLRYDLKERLSLSSGLGGESWLYYMMVEWESQRLILGRESSSKKPHCHLSPPPLLSRGEEKVKTTFSPTAQRRKGGTELV